MKNLPKMAKRTVQVVSLSVLCTVSLLATDINYVTGIIQDETARNDTMMATKAYPFRDVRGDYRDEGPYADDMKLVYSARLPQTTSMGQPVESGHEGPAHYVYFDDPQKLRALNAFSSAYGPFGLIKGDLSYLFNQYPNDTVIQLAFANWASQRGWRPIYIDPNDSSELDNAYYVRYANDRREINFFMMSSKDDWSVAGDQSTADGSDVPAHEAGHAILDLLWPELFDQNSISAGGIHEAWGDWMAVSWTLHQRSLCESAYQETLGDLNRPSFVNRIAEAFGASFGDKDGLRFLEDDLHIKNAEGEVHAASIVLAGAWWDILKGALTNLEGMLEGDSDLDEQTVGRYKETPAEMLYDVSQYFRRLLVESVVRTDRDTGTFSEVGRSMHDVVSRRPTVFDSVMTKLPWAQLIETEFTRRGIWYNDPEVESNEAVLEGYLTEKTGEKSICHTLGHAVGCRKDSGAYNKKVEKKVLKAKKVKKKNLKQSEKKKKSSKRKKAAE